MAKTLCQALDNRGIAFKYILRLLTVEQARQFESHLAGCEYCSEELTRITRFFELLRKSLNLRPIPAAAQTPAETAAAQTLPSPQNLDSEKIVTVFVNCFAGFQKLCKNIATRIGPKVEMAQ